MNQSRQPESSSAAPELRAQFWILVGVLNVALLAMAFGVLVLAFWRRPWLGTGSLVVGLAALTLAYVRYRSVTGAT